MSQPDEQPSNQKPEKSSFLTKLSGKKFSRRHFLAGVGVSAAATLPVAGYEFKDSLDQRQDQRGFTIAVDAKYLADEATRSYFTNKSIRELFPEQLTERAQDEQGKEFHRIKPGSIDAVLDYNQQSLIALLKLSGAELRAARSEVEKTPLADRGEVIAPLLEKGRQLVNAQGI